jgi:hypothetical protein
MDHPDGEPEDAPGDSVERPVLDASSRGSWNFSLDDGHRARTLRDSTWDDGHVVRYFGTPVPIACYHTVP